MPVARPTRIPVELFGFAIVAEKAAPRCVRFDLLGLWERKGEKGVSNAAHRPRRVALREMLRRETIVSAR